MRYDRRVKLMLTEETKTSMGYETVVIGEEILPCQEQPLSIEEETAIFGGYTQERIKLHVLTLPFHCNKVYYTPRGETEEKEYDIQTIRQFRKRAVLFLEEVV